jgi:methionyl-tRNA synthetase
MRFNAELADTYGNLVNRGLKLCESYCGGKV